MISRHTERLAAVALSMAFVPALISAAPAPPGGIRLVHPGESVQAAVDAARPGDVIELLAGVHKGSVTLSTDRVTLRGQGERTVLQPDSGGQGSCARTGHGLCIVGRPGAPVTGVTIESLTLTGFAKNGLNASGTDALTVRAVLAHHNGQQGISQELSTRSVLLGNEDG